MKVPPVLGGLLYSGAPLCRLQALWGNTLPAGTLLGGRSLLLLRSGQRAGSDQVSSAFTPANRIVKRGNFFFSEVHTCGRSWQAGLLLP